MADINISINDLICESPIFTSVTYTGNMYEFNMNWISKGEFYSSFDPTVTMYLRIDLYREGSTTAYFSGSVGNSPPIPFIGDNYLLNILDYDGTFTSKDRIVFTLTLSGEDSCFTETTYEIPSNTIP